MIFLIDPSFAQSYYHLAYIQISKENNMQIHSTPDVVFFFFNIYIFFFIKKCCGAPQKPSNQGASIRITSVFASMFRQVFEHEQICPHINCSFFVVFFTFSMFLSITFP